MALLLGAQVASAYNTFGPYPWGDTGLTYYNKWGDIFNPGSVGGTVTWSIMPDGTTIDPSFTDTHFTGTSSFHALIDSFGEADAMAAIQRAFDHWSAVTNIYYVQVPDSGLPFNSPDADPPSTGQIRIGAFEIRDDQGMASFVGSVGYAAPPNGGTLAGDVLFNSLNNFQFAPGNEGDQFYFDVGLYKNDFESLLIHELGHTLGLDHTTNGSVMDPSNFKVINRIPDPDDVAGVQFLYGPALHSDFDHNNGVHAADLALWRASFGTAIGATQPQGDATGDGSIDGADFLVWQRELGQGAAEAIIAGTAVPEPDCWALVASATGVVVAGTHRRGRIERRSALAKI